MGEPAVIHFFETIEINCLINLQQDTDLYNKLQPNCLAVAKRFERSVLAGRILAILQKRAQ